MQQNNFPLSFFPDILADIITRTSKDYNFNPDFLAASILSASATAVGNSYCVQVKGDWIERNTNYIAIVASPGMNKSAPLKWALSPLQKQEKELFKVYKSMIKEFSENPANKDRQPPPLIKTIIGDATPEAVVQQLDKNERGVMIYVDELAGYLATFQRYSKGNDEQFYLSVWSGHPVVVDRKTSASIRINTPVLNIVGTIQPNIFDKCFNNKEDSGFFDRWLIVNPPNPEKLPWSDNDISQDVADHYERIVNRLLSLQLYINQFDESEAKVLRYGQEAWEIIKKWQRSNTSSINYADQDHIKAIRAKMEIYIHRFAMLNHLLLYACDGQLLSPDHAITSISAKAACKLADYFIENALKARSGDPAENLQGVHRDIFSMLPDIPFTTHQFLELAETFGLTERSAKRWLDKNSLPKGKLITKIKHGTYAKN